MRLDPEQRAWIVAVLDQASIDLSTEKVEGLIAAIESSMAVISARRAGKVSYRESHNRLRALWRLLNAPDPSIGLIRRRFAELPPDRHTEAAERAERLWPRLLRGQAYPPEGLLAWSRTAPADQLIDVLSAVISDGGVPVSGRWRGDDKRSPSRFEPLIMGTARGAGDRASTAEHDGRPRIDDAIDFVTFLAMDWATATGQVPQAGRSDQTPFGALVHHVFGWLGLDNASNALRAYWAEMAAEDPD